MASRMTPEEYFSSQKQKNSKIYNNAPAPVQEYVGQESFGNNRVFFQRPRILFSSSEDSLLPNGGAIVVMGVVAVVAIVAIVAIARR